MPLKKKGGKAKGKSSGAKKKSDWVSKYPADYDPPNPNFLAGASHGTAAVAESADNPWLLHGAHWHASPPQARCIAPRPNQLASSGRHTHILIVCGSPRTESRMFVMVTVRGITWSVLDFTERIPASKRVYDLRNMIHKRHGDQRCSQRCQASPVVVWLRSAVPPCISIVQSVVQVQKAARIASPW